MTAEPAREVVDANVLVAHDSSAGDKKAADDRLLQRLWPSGRGCVSVQVLQQFFVTVTRKVASPSPEAERRRLERDREAAERLLSRTCAWCLCAIQDDSPVVAVFATLQARRDDVEREAGMTSIMIAGRMVPGRVPGPGSNASAHGDIAFMVCSERCAGEIRAAVAREQSSSIVH